MFFDYKFSIKFKLIYCIKYNLPIALYMTLDNDYKNNYLNYLKLA